MKDVTVENTFALAEGNKMVTGFEAENQVIASAQVKATNRLAAAIEKLTATLEHAEKERQDERARTELKERLNYRNTGGRRDDDDD